jgi:hypothetical protein
MVATTSGRIWNLTVKRDSLSKPHLITVEAGLKDSYPKGGQRLPVVYQLIICNVICSFKYWAMVAATSGEKWNRASVIVYGIPVMRTALSPTSNWRQVWRTAARRPTVRSSWILRDGGGDKRRKMEPCGPVWYFLDTCYEDSFVPNLQLEAGLEDSCEEASCQQ